jgi:hypothetical protein
LQVLDRWAQAVARSAARCLSQVPGRGAQANPRGAARSASRVLDCGAQAVARGAATLSQQEKNNSVDLKRNREKKIGFFCRVAMQPSR